MGPAWKRTTKAYVAHTLISLTKLSETAKDPSATMELPITWKALAALCVLDQDHAVKLSSARAVQEKDKVTDIFSMFEVCDFGLMGRSILNQFVFC